MSQPSPVTASTPTPVLTKVPDPYGSGSSFSWSGSTGVEHIPQPGDSDYLQYQQALGNWISEREQAYRQSPKFQEDQYHTNPAVASGAVPAIGFRPEGPNAWGLPANSEVTSLTQQPDGGYSVGYKDLGTMQKVSVQGPGYGYEGYVRAPSAEAASQMVLSGFKAQVAGVDVSPSKIGGYTASSSNSLNDGKVVGGEAVIQAGDPKQNAYWVEQGLPQYAAYTPPSLSASERSEGFHIDKIEANGLAPKVTIGNTNYENFWQQQGHPELSKYQPPSLQANEYIFDPVIKDNGQLSYKIGSTSWESQWAKLGVTDINTIRGYQAPSDLPSGSYATVTKPNDVSSIQFGNTEWERQWKDLGVTDLSIVRGYTPPSNVVQGSYVTDIAKTDQGLSYKMGNRISEAKLAELNTEISTVNEQNQRFTQAYNLGVQHPELIGKAGSGAISLSEYQKAMAKQNQNTKGYLETAESYGFINASEKQASISQLDSNMQNINALSIASYEPSSQPARSVTKVYSAFNPAVSPLGVDPSNDITRVAKTDVNDKTLLVRSDYKLANVQTVSLGNQQQTTYTLVPKNQEVPKNTISNDVFTFSNINFAGVQPIVNTNEKRLIALEVVSAIITAPAAAAVQGAKTTTQGLITIGKNVAAGVVTSQGIKTAVYSLQGKDIAQSVLSPTEVLEAGAGSVILSGAVGKASKVLGIAGKGVEPAVERTALYGTVGAAGGAVGEYAQTGRVTAEGPAIGGLTALGIGALAESSGLISRGKSSFTEPINNRFGGGKIVASEIKTNTLLADSKTISPEIKTNTIGIPKSSDSNIVVNSKRSEFITGVSGNNRSQPNGMPNYLIKQPEMKNLEISKTIKIRNPNSFNPDQANARIDMLMNQVPSRGNYDDYSNIMMSGGKTIVATKGANSKTSSDTQLSKIEELTNQQLPRSTPQTIEEINAKIDQHSFDAKATNAKINAQLKQANAFDVDRVNTNIAKALKEAELEKANAGKFTTALGKESSAIKSSNYLIKQPVLTNLTISERINIRNPNAFNPTEANDKTNAMIKEVNSNSSYIDYHSILSQGKTLVATKQKSALYDTQLSHIDQLSNEPLPRSIEAKNQPLPASIFSGTDKTPASGMIAKVNVDNVKQSVNQRMQTQFAGVDTFTASRLYQRVTPLSASDAIAKIDVQLSSGKSSTVQEQFLGQHSKLGVGQESNLSTSQVQSTNQKQMVALSTNVAQSQLQDIMVDQMQDISQSQSVGLSLKTSLSVRQSNSELNTNVWAAGRYDGKKSVRSIPFVNPILTGFQLLGKRESGDEQPFF